MFGGTERALRDELDGGGKEEDRRQEEAKQRRKDGQTTQQSDTSHIRKSDL